MLTDGMVEAGEAAGEDSQISLPCESPGLNTRQRQSAKAGGRRYRRWLTITIHYFPMGYPIPDGPRPGAECKHVDAIPSFNKFGVAPTSWLDKWRLHDGIRETLQAHDCPNRLPTLSGQYWISVQPQGDFSNYHLLHRRVAKG